jgi:hypothetical protein
VQNHSDAGGLHLSHEFGDGRQTIVGIRDQSNTH